VNKFWDDASIINEQRRTAIIKIVTTGHYNLQK
jgi:hypothetical protein